MCLNPIRVRNNSTYKVSSLSPTLYEVPCGTCDECLAIKQSEWDLRISFELQALYFRGGFSVFLTFSYNDENLPYYIDEDNDFKFPCFRWSDVTTFLNRLKVSMSRLYGNNMYKYFITSEFGKNTHRPHYHGLFNLEKGVNLFEFCELCRKLWTYGFMFPKFDEKKGHYVDSYGRYTTPEITSRTGTVRYVCKYITKDLAFMQDPAVADYISEKSHYIRMSKCFPKHWQSKNFGVTIFDSLDLFNFTDTLEKGVQHPFTMKFVPIPRYVLNKLKYKNISTKGTSFERKSEVTGKYLYLSLIHI